MNLTTTQRAAQRWAIGALVGALSGPNRPADDDVIEAVRQIIDEHLALLLLRQCAHGVPLTEKCRTCPHGHRAPAPEARQ